MIYRYSKSTLSLLAAISLVGCGGGGGGGAPAPSAPKYMQNNGLSINAGFGGGGTGNQMQGGQLPNNTNSALSGKTSTTYLSEGISMSLQDTNNDENVKKIAGIVDNSFLLDDIFKDSSGNFRVESVPGFSLGANPTVGSHGTSVLGVFAANNKDSKIFVKHSGRGKGVPIDKQNFDVLYNQGARVINNSYGIPSTYEYAASMKSIVGDKPETDSIFVWAAGNQGGKGDSANHATTQSLYPFLKDEARNGWITVAAVFKDNDTKLAYYSSKIGKTAKTWGITAKGSQTVKFTNKTATLHGTSIAAPVVSATATNVWNKFPWMSNHLVVVSVLSTANKPGTNTQTQEPDETFGWGILNPNRALRGPGRFDTRLLTNKDSENKLLVVDFNYRNYVNKDKITWSNDIAGDAGILKRGTGTLYMSGANTYSGDTKIENGALSFSKSLKNSKVIIEKDGTFESKNANKVVEVGNANSYSFTNKGSLNVYGKGLKINGDYEADTDSRIVIDMHKSNLQVAGAMNMNNSRILADIEKVDEVPNSRENTRTIITAKQISNYDGRYNISDRISRLIRIIGLTHNSSRVDIKYTRENVVNAISKYTAPTLSAQNTGANLDRVLDDLSNNKNSSLTASALTLFSMQASQLSVAVDTLSAEIHASSLNTLSATNKIFNRVASDRVYNSIMYANSGFWFDGVYGKTKLKQEGFASADVDTAGSLVGFDYKIDDRATLGFSMFQGISKADFNKYAGKNNIKTIGASVYGGYEFDNFYISSRVSYMGANNEVSREIINKNSKIKYNSSSYGLYTEIGKNFNFNNKNFNLYLSNDLNHIRRDGFSESVAFGITSANEDYTLDSLLFGARANISSGKFNVTANANHAYLLSSKDFSFVANYTSNNTPILIKGISEARHTTFIGLGLDYEIYKNLNINFKADKSILHNRSSNNIFRLGFRWDI